MNVLKPHLRTTVRTLLDKGVSQREIKRKTRVDRKTIRRNGRLYDLLPPPDNDISKSPTVEGVATGSGAESGQNPPARPPAPATNLPKHARSACEPHREWIEEQLRLGRNAMAIYQDLVERWGFTHRYNSVKRFVRGLKRKDPEQYDRGQGDDADEEQDEDQRVHPHPRVEHDVGSHDPADGARRPDRRHGTRERRKDVRPRSDESRQQVEHGKADAPHRVLDVVAEDPQEPHVADQVHPAPVHEHRGEERDRTRPVDPAVSRSQRHQGPRGDPPRDLSWNGSVSTEGLEKARPRTGLLEHQPDRDVGHDDRHRDVRRDLGRIVVLEWNHDLS